VEVQSGDVVTEIVVAQMQDTWANSAATNRNYGSTDRVRVRNLERRGFVLPQLAAVRGRTVLSATLTGHLAEDATAQTYTVKGITESWSAGTLTWSNQPTAPSTNSSTTSPGALVAGDEVTWDVRALVQNVADGGKWYGLQISTDSATGAAFYSASDGAPAWALTVELSDAPEQPDDLRPDQGAVGSGAPILAWSFADLGGESTEQGSLQVQVDPAANGTAPAFDSGWVASADPQYDLSTSTFTALAANASTQWRVRVKDAAGVQSVWSDWASFTYKPKPTLTVSSPTGGVIGDPTPDVIASLSGETLTQWRIRIAAGDDKSDILYNSHLQDGPISWTIPLRNHDGRRIIRDDNNYWLNVQAWGDVDRATAVGDPPYVYEWIQFHANDDVTVAPTSLTVAPATPGSPRATFSWFRNEAADAWVIFMDDEVFARLDASDVTVSTTTPGNYSWTDTGLLPPYEAHKFKVKAIDAGKRSPASGTTTYTSEPAGVWLIRPNGDTVVLDGTAVESFAQLDRRATYKPLNVATDVDIVYGFEGVSGSFSGSIQTASDQNVHTAKRRLEKIRTAITERPQLIWGTHSMPVQIKNMRVLTDPDFAPNNLKHGVSFDFIQDGD
jgi:hypothetical protein